MFPLRQPPANEPAILSHEDILALENAAVRRRRRLRWLRGGVVLALVIGVGFGARPALHVVKAWQARRLAADARRLMDAEKWLDARREVGDAYALWQQEPDAVRVTAQFLNRVGNFRQSLTYWKRLEELHPLTPEDQREFAAAELASGDVDLAETRLRRAWPDGTPGTRADWQMGMQIALRRERSADAAAFARRLLADPATPGRQRLSAAAVLMATDAGVDAQRLGWQTVEAVATGGKTPESLDALLALARRAAANPSVDGPAPAGLPPLPDLIARLAAHPLAKIQHHLFAVDLRLSQDPAHRAELIQQTVERYGATKDDADLAALTAWLYTKGEYDKVLALLPPARASGDRALFLQRLDTFGALGRWTDIRADIQNRMFPLEPMVAQMYLARCAGQLGEPDVRDACWDAALAAAGTEPGKLIAVGQYASKNGAMALAGKAFRAAVTAAPDLRDANEALFHLLEATGQTRGLREALIAFAAHAPEDRALRNDVAYFDALLDVDVPSARDTARQLAGGEPASLPHRVTLALAELRLNNGLAAVDAFKGIALPPLAAMQPRQRAVYAAVLWKASYERQAREIVRSLTPEQLLPEERELIRPVLENPAP